MAAFERAKKVGGDIVLLKEPYLGGSLMAHPAYKIWWGTVGKRKEQRVAIGIAITTENRLIEEARTDIINHPCIHTLYI